MNKPVSSQIRSSVGSARRSAWRSGEPIGAAGVGTRVAARARGEAGSQMLELALVMPMLVSLLVGAVDFGRAYYIGMEVNSAAEAGTMYGLTNATDTAGMKTAAMADAPDIPNMTATAMYGTECADGSSVVIGGSTSSANCPSSVVLFVEVDTTTTYIPILFYPGFQSAFTLTGKSRIRASF